MGVLFELKPLSSLAKVFPDKIYGDEQSSFTAFAGEELNFQIAMKTIELKYRKMEYTIEIVSDFTDVTAYEVGCVPAWLAAYPTTSDEDYITKESGLFPDPLIPIRKNRVSVAVGKWSAVWISVKIPQEAYVGDHSVRVVFRDENAVIIGEVSFKITVCDIILPSQKILFTQWFHCDCIASVHGVEMFSEKHWELIEKYLALATEHGMNTVLTPVFTLALDTAVGAERPTHQLVDIFKDGDTYSFSFTRLERFVSIAIKCGITDFEISHLFTQWGAAFAPKVVAYVDGEKKKIFGWNTHADDGEYIRFLSVFIPKLREFFERIGVSGDRLWFHVSDEPKADHLEQYKVSKSIISELIKGAHHIDALSEIDFYREGLVETPVVATSKIEPYIEASIPDIWCYYCCSQSVDVANRFLAMPSYRNRIIGLQMYKYGIKGFLQWGYNFYYSQLSKRVIDPYRETDGGGAFPAGDPFSVYPYGDDVIPSLRLKVFKQALDDIRLLELWEDKIGRAEVVKRIETLAGMEITFKKYPKGEKIFEQITLAAVNDLK